MSRFSTTVLALTLTLAAFILATSFALLAAGWFMINYLLNATPIISFPSGV